MRRLRPLPPSGARRPFAVAAFGARTLLAMSLLIGGCASEPPVAPVAPAADGTTIDERRETDGAVDEGTKPTASPSAPAAASPNYLDAIARQALRLRRLQFLDSAGVVEFRWTDEKGDHFEQGDLNLYMMLPWKTAFSIAKLGTRMAWIGSDESGWWIFLLQEKPTSVQISPWEASPRDVRGEGMSIVSPRAFLHLAGLSPFPAPELVTVTEDEAAKTIVVESKPIVGATEPRMRWTLDRVSKLPTKVELLDDLGAPVVTGLLTEYLSAPIEGAPPGDFPQVPRQINVARTDGRGSLKIALEGPSARGEKVQPRFFRLDDLRKELRPDESYTRVAPMPVTPPTPTAPSHTR